MAIGFLRKHQKRIWWPVAIIVIGSFVFWGGGSKLMSSIRGGGGSYAEIDGRQISSHEVSRRINITQLVTGYGFPRGSDAAARTILIEMMTALAAHKAGLGVSDDELREFIRAFAMRHLGAKFTDEDLNLYLSEREVPAGLFQEVAKDMLVEDRMRRILVSSAAVTAEERYTDYCRNKDLLTVRYVDFKTSEFREKVEKPTDADVKEAFDARVAAGYGAAPDVFSPPSAKIRYAIALSRDYESKVEVSPEGLREHYDQTKYLYRREKPEEKKDEKKDEKAGEVKEEAKGAKDAAGAAGEPAEPSGAAAEGAPAPAQGDKAAEGGEAAGAAAGGEKPKEASPFKEFDEVRSEVEADYRKRAAHGLAAKALQELLDAAGDDVAAVEKALADKSFEIAEAVVTSEALDKMDAFGEATELARGIFGPKKNRQEPNVWSTSPVSTEKGAVAFELIEFTEAAPKPLSECAAKISKELLDDRAAKAARAAAEEVRQDLIAERYDRARMSETPPTPAGDASMAACRELIVDQIPPQAELRTEGDDSVCRIGIVTSRTSPSREAFAADKEWRPPEEPERSIAVFLYAGWQDQVRRKTPARLLQPPKPQAEPAPSGAEEGEEGGDEEE